ncbi:hypothetical protein Syun_020890 [Stephania yunnanensis]|uniref:Uncharacterized protein n=1 Tax=Stephania yunnanensis TaxID=152371 RepID=A0AAP0IFH6_9MAGN
MEMESDLKEIKVDVVFLKLDMKFQMQDLVVMMGDLVVITLDLVVTKVLSATRERKNVMTVYDMPSSFLSVCIIF